MIARCELHNSDFEILEERLSSLCKIYKKGASTHFAQFYVQTGSLGEAIIKGLDSPNLRFSERKKIHKVMWSYIAKNMGYKTGTMQRVKRNLKPITITKSLSGYKK
mgnify:CR=1 FL=1